MTLMRNGEPVPADELAAEYARDLRDYTDLSDAEIKAKVRESYPAVVRRWELEGVRP